MKRSSLAVYALIIAGAPSLAAAQTLTKCTTGQPVMDREGKTGVIVSDGTSLCQVKYADGQVYGWIFWNLRPAGEPAKSAPDNSAASPPPATAQGLSVLRPPSARTLVYRADPRGHFTLTAAAHGPAVRFLVDTAAILGVLTPEDARPAPFCR